MRIKSTHIQGDQQEESRQIKINQIRMKNAIREQKKMYQRKLFGQHYNYNKIGLNKDKKLWIEEQRSTEIERNNRILLSKLKRIHENSVRNKVLRRIATQEGESLGEDSYRQSNLTDKRMHRFSTERPSAKSHAQIGKSKASLSHHLNPIIQKHLVFRGYRDISGAKFMIKISQDEQHCWVQAEKPNFKQSIKIPKQQYLNLLSQKVEGDDLRCHQILMFDGMSIKLVESCEDVFSKVQISRVKLDSKHSVAQLTDA